MKWAIVMVACAILVHSDNGFACGSGTFAGLIAWAQVVFDKE